MRGVTFKRFKVYSVAAFQLTRLMRGVTALGIPDKYAMEFQLTRLMRGVTLYSYFMTCPPC